MNEWKDVSIGDLCETVSNTYKRKDQEVVLVNTSDVLEGKILNHQPVPNENLKGQFKKTFKKNLFKFFTPAYGKYNMNNFFALFYKGIFGYKNIHVTLPHLKSTFKEVWEKEEYLLDTVCHNRFRSYNDVNHYLMSNWNIETNRFVPQNIKIGKYFSFVDVSDVIDSVLNRKDKIICINDDVNDIDFEQLSEEILKGFNKRYPKKSSFEK